MKGDTSGYDKALELVDGNQAALDALETIFYQANEERRNLAQV